MITTVDAIAEWKGTNVNRYLIFRQVLDHVLSHQKKEKKNVDLPSNLAVDRILWDHPS